MSWARLDDSFWRNTKVGQISNTAVAVYLFAISYSAGELTEGRLSPKIVSVLCLMRDAEVEPICHELVTAGLWEDRGDGAYQIHDFLKYNPTREHVLEEREKARVRQEDWRERQKTFAEGRHVDEPTTDGTPNGTTNVVTNAKRNMRPVPGPGPGPGSPDPDPGSLASADALAGEEIEAPAERKAKTPTEAQQMWTALCQEILPDPQAGFSKAARGAWNAAIKDLREAGVKPEEVPRLCRNYAFRYGKSPPTPHAIVAHLPEIRGPTQAMPTRSGNGGMKHGDNRGRARKTEELVINLRDPTIYAEG